MNDDMMMMVVVLFFKSILIHAKQYNQVYK